MFSLLTGLSDAGLASWSFWLQVVGFVSVASVAVAFAAGHLVNREVAGRANKKWAASQVLLATAGAESATARAEEEETRRTLDAALAKKAPREITEAQKSSFTAALKDTPKGHVEVYIYDYRDAEVLGYSYQIRDLLMAAGYDCGDKVEISPQPFSPQGLLVVAKDPANAPTYAGAIQHAFGLIGIDAPAGKDGSLDADRVVVVVGRRFD